MITSEQRKTGNRAYALDLTRSPFAGILESGMHTFVLLIAIRVFEPGPNAKAAISAAIPIGLLVSPFVLSLVSRFNLRATQAASLCWITASILLCFASVADSFTLFFFTLTPSMFFYALVPTFMIFAYSHNYTAKQRGQRIAVFFMISSTASVIFAYFSGKSLDHELSNYRNILIVMASAGALSALCGQLMPSPKVEAQHNANPFKNISLIWNDPLFGWIVLSWMFIGLANLMTIPLRVEYLANPAYGIEANNKEITWLVVGIPSVCRILSTRIWGYLFDKINLLLLRSVLNAMFLIGIFLFFQTKDFTVQAIAMVIVGTAHGGGNIAWTLWVTKIAPPEKTAAYMSVHTATTGIRGILSPFLGFFLIAQFGPAPTAWLASGLALFSILINIPLIQDRRLKQ